MSARSIVKNTIYVYTGEFFSNIFQFIFIILLTRYLGAEGFGKISFALSLGWFIVIFSDVGINHIMFREMSVKSSKIMHHRFLALTLKIFLGIMTLIVTVLLMILAGFSQERFFVVLIICSAFILDATGQLFRNALMSIKKMNYESVVRIVFGGSKLLIFLALWYMKTGLLLITSIYFFSSLLTLITAAFFLMKKIGKIKFVVDIKYSKWLIKESYPLLFGAVSMKMLLGIDIIMLTWLKGDYVTGIYSAPSRLIMNGFFFSEILAASALPYLATYLKKDKKIFARLTNVLTASYNIIFIPVVVASIIYPQKIIHLIFGGEFIPGSQVLTVFSVILILYYFSALFHTLYLLTHRVKRLATIMVFAATINAILNYVLITKYSYMGAAYATVFSFTLLILIEYFILIKTKLKINLLGTILKSLALFILTVTAIHSIKSASMAIILAAFLIIYSLLIIVLKVLPSQDIILLLESLKLGKIAQKIKKFI